MICLNLMKKHLEIWLQDIFKHLPNTKKELDQLII